MTRTAVMLRRLVLLQHLLLAVLVVVGLARGLAAGAPPAPLLGSSAVLVLWYAVGAARAEGHVGLDPAPARPGRGLGAGGWWVIGLVAAWLLTVAASPEMVWVAFSLWLLSGHLLPPAPAVALSGLVLAVVVGRAGHADGWSTAAVVGPTIGAVFALALSRGLHLAVADSLERERLVTSLVAAQEEAEVLQAELVEAQRAAGALGERTRLSRDIHDTLAQGFSSILLLARAAAATTQDAADRARLLGQIETSAADHLEEARRVVGALAPVPLESGLVEALRRIVAQLEAQTGVRGGVRVQGEVTALPVPVEVALLRTAQSALANVRRHSGAGSVVVTLTEAGDSIRLDVVDDGVGFDLATVRAPAAGAAGGYGLRASRERLLELGGGLEVDSAPGVGTAVSAHLPRGTAGAVR